MTGRPIVVALDKPREIKWTPEAEYRASELGCSLRDLQDKKRFFAFLCKIVFAALVDESHGFNSPADLAKFLATDEQKLAAIEAVREMVDSNSLQKKSQSNESSLNSGQTPSSQSA